MFVIDYPIFKYVKRFFAEKLRERVCKLAIVAFLYIFKSFNCGVGRYLVINLIVLDSHVIQPFIINVWSSCGNDKGIIWVGELFCSVFAKHYLLWHHYFPSHQVLGLCSWCFMSY